MRERRTWNRAPNTCQAPAPLTAEADGQEPENTTCNIVLVPILRTSLTSEINNLVRVLFDLKAHTMLTDEQLKTWQARLRQQARHMGHIFPDRFTRNCLYHFDPATYRDVRKFVHIALAAIQQGGQRANPLIHWQRSLRLRCKTQPLPVGLWRQLIYDCELDDLASSVGFSCSASQKEYRKVHN